jgi:4-aminobutyrate aminotransferase-like enzyme
VAPFPVDDAHADWCLEQVRFLLKAQTAPAETAAIVIEPELGEGGYLPAPVAFLRGLEEICREHGILFVADEVQTGFGRTGRMFAVDHYGVRPDVLVMAKGLGSGFPISAIGASDELMTRWPRGSHGGTYGGNPIGCAAALATIDVLSEPGFLENVRARGDQLRAGLVEQQRLDDGIVDVRGWGLMVGSQFADPTRVAAVQAHCLEEGHLILMNAGTNNDVLRWMPPLVVTEGEIATALAAFAAALKATSP